jgi:hypothetical protein
MKDGHNSARPSPSKRLNPERPHQQVPAEIIADLLQAACNFYGDCPDKWHADQHFIKRNVITWPARWLNTRGITLTPDRYKEIVLEVFQGIKQHGQTEKVKYWPAYLMHSVQTHFKLHGEQYYNEGKSLRLKLESALLGAQRSIVADPVSALADVNRALAAKKPSKKPTAKDQLTLL